MTGAIHDFQRGESEPGKDGAGKDPACRESMQDADQGVRNSRFARMRVMSDERWPFVELSRDQLSDSNVTSCAKKEAQGCYHNVS